MPPPPGPRRLPLLAVVAVLVAVAAVVAVVAGGGGGDGGGTTTADESPAAEDGDGDGSGAGEATAPVSVDGEALPPRPDGGDDPAVGMPMPVLAGTSVTGQPLVVGADGPGLVLFLAHWCPHCRAEVPRLQEWLSAGGLPQGTSIMAVSTGADPAAPNYPPSEWLAGEGWEPPTLLDSEEMAAAEAVGLTAYPFFVFVDGDGRVASRATGELSVDVVESTLRSLAGG